MLIATWHDVFGQIIATSHDLTPNGGLVREIPLFQGNLGWWNITIWPPFLYVTASDSSHLKWWRSGMDLTCHLTRWSMVDMCIGLIVASNKQLFRSVHAFWTNFNSFTQHLKYEFLVICSPKSFQNWCIPRVFSAQQWWFYYVLDILGHAFQTWWFCCG